jgi:hypothetical protein
LILLVLDVVAGICFLPFFTCVLVFCFLLLDNCPGGFCLSVVGAGVKLLKDRKDSLDSKRVLKLVNVVEKVFCVVDLWVVGGRVVFI